MDVFKENKYEYTTYSIPPNHKHNCTIMVNLKVKAVHLKQREVVNNYILVYSCQLQWDWAEQQKRRADCFISLLFTKVVEEVYFRQLGLSKQSMYYKHS